MSTNTQKIYKYRMGFTKEQMAKGGRSQAEKLYICPSCGDCGGTNKMIHHIKNCDGTGLKNYWAKKRSKELLKYLASIF